MNVMYNKIHANYPFKLGDTYSASFYKPGWLEISGQLYREEFFIRIEGESELNTSEPHINEEVKQVLQQAKAEPSFAGTVLEGKEARYQIIKYDDLVKYNTPFDLNHIAPLMDSLIENIERGRAADGKNPHNSYIVINTDEDPKMLEEIIDVMRRYGKWED